jgi:hypothetical protein
MCRGITTRASQRVSYVCTTWVLMVRGTQDDDERGECMVALAQVARSIDISDLASLRDMAAVYAQAVSLVNNTSPLEALCSVFLSAMTSKHQALATDELSKTFSFLQMRLVIILEDQNPAAALRVLLSAAAHASGARAHDSANLLLDSALAVYHRYCAFPPTAMGGLMQVMHGVAQLRGLLRERYDSIVEQVARYASSMPVREDKVHLLPLPPFPRVLTVLSPSWPSSNAVCGKCLPHPQLGACTPLG